MQNNDYFFIKISPLSQDEVDLVTEMVFSAGACGTEEALHFEQNNRVYEPVTLVKEATELLVYFENPPPAELLENLKSKFAKAQVTVMQNANKDWMAEWKKGFVPFCLAGDIWVVPSWCGKPIEAQSVIRMDPGMAFGTGTHETTKLAASFIADYAPQFLGRTSPETSTLLDVGTGTGILAIQAELCGFSTIVANDIDLEARRVTRENLELNASKKIRVVEESLNAIPGEFDWVVANIIDGVLVELQKDLVLRTREGGFLVLTGILAERDELFRKNFSFADLQVIERREMGEWVGYLLGKKVDK